MSAPGITLTGLLLAEAPRVQLVRGGADLEVWLQTPAGTRVLARQVYRGLGAETFAQNDAQRLRSAPRVTCHCSGFVPVMTPQLPTGELRAVGAWIEAEGNA